MLKGLGISRKSDFEGQWDLISGLSQNWGNRDSTLGGYKENRARSRTWGKGAVTRQETESDLSANIGGFPMELS